jgi:hypothetical protein
MGNWATDVTTGLFFQAKKLLLMTRVAVITPV